MRILLADDLTGACDAGIAFAQAGISVDVPLSETAISTPRLSEQPQMLAINTASRNISPEEASSKVARIAARLLPLHPELVYKKIDSTMRGNAGGEIEALSGAFGLEPVFIAPAALEHGRTVRNGRLFINDTPLHATDFAKDPLAPVRSSDLTELLGQPQKTAAISLATLDAGMDATLAEVNRLRARGFSWLIFDAVNARQLETVAKTGLSLPKTPLFAGSAGLAKALAMQLGSFKPAATLKKTDSVFFVSGSAHKATHAQLEKLREAGARIFQLPEDFKNPSKLQEIVPGIVENLTRGSCVLAPPAKRFANIACAEAISQIVAETALAVLAKLPQALAPALCIAGGETAFHLLSRISEILRLRDEIEPGVALSTPLTGGFAGLPVATKAGGFGDELTLLRIDQFFKKGKGQ